MPYNGTFFEVSEPKPEWKRREIRKFNDGTYKRIYLQYGNVIQTRELYQKVWNRETEIFENHYPHQSLIDENLIAYTPDDSKGEADRQTSTKPGKFLNKFYGDLLEPPQIADLAAYWVNDYGRQNLELKFARTPDEIEMVYQNGPSSCMSYEIGEYQSHIQPVRVFGAGDLSVAYVQRDTDGKITARALCWEKKKAIGRIYGDEIRFTSKLIDEGYKRKNMNAPWLFDGAKLLRIKSGDSFVMPYLDGDLWVIEKQKYFYITANYQTGAMEALNTSGLLPSGPYTYCTCCECDIESEDDCYRIQDEGPYCYDCFTEHSTGCENCGDVVFNDETRSIDYDDEYWCQHCADRKATECNDCGELFTDSHMSDKLNPKGEKVCVDCAEDNYHLSPCGDTLEDDTHECDCSECEDERGEDE